MSNINEKKIFSTVKIKDGYLEKEITERKVVRYFDEISYAPPIVITRESNAPLMDVMYKAGLAANKDFMTREEVQAVTDDDIRDCWLIEDLYASPVPRDVLVTFFEMGFGGENPTSILRFNKDNIFQVNDILITDGVEATDKNGKKNPLLLYVASITTTDRGIKNYNVVSLNHYNSSAQTYIVPEINEGERFMKLGKSSVTHFEEFKYFTNITSLPEYCFMGCNDLESIIIPPTITYLGTWHHNVGVDGRWQHLFNDCTNLVSVIVDSNNPKYDSRDNCNAIIETSRNSMIYGCKNTIIPNSVTSLDRACFYGCSSLTSITLPESIIWLGSGCFSRCSSLTSIEIPSSVTSIESDCFYNCTSLTSVDFSKAINLYDIGEECFYNCTGLTSIDLSKAITLGRLSRSCFEGCTNLASIVIPNYIQNDEPLFMRASCFASCINLNSITCLAMVAPNIQNAFGNSTDTYTGYNTKPNVLKIPTEATGYDTGYWLDPLQNESKCGFTIEYI